MFPYIYVAVLEFSLRSWGLGSLFVVHTRRRQDIEEVVLLEIMLTTILLGAEMWYPYQLRMVLQTVI